MTNIVNNTPYFRNRLTEVDENLHKFIQDFNIDTIRGLETIGSIDENFFEESLRQPLINILSHKGKRVRPLITYLSHDLNGGNYESIGEVAIIPELIHRGSLVIDDIEDDSFYRGSIPSIHSTLGIPLSINFGNLLYFSSYFILKNLDVEERKKLTILNDMIRMSVVAHLGQGSDLFWQEKMSIPLEEVYLQMCSYKASTLVFAAQIGSTLSNHTEKQRTYLSNAIELASIGYQLRDDVLDYEDDFKNRKTSLILIHALQTTSNRKLDEIVRKKEPNTQDVNDALNLIQESNAVSYVNQKAQELIETGTKSIDQVFEDSEHKKYLTQLFEYLITRKV